MRPPCPLRRIAVLIPFIGLDACQPPSPTVGLPALPLSSQENESSRSTRLTEPALRSVDAANAEELVRRLRPEFIRARPVPRDMTGTVMFPAVFIDGIYSGGPDVLRLVPVSAVVEIQYLDASRAQDLGPRCDCRVGAIAVITRRR